LTFLIRTRRISAAGPGGGSVISSYCSPKKFISADSEFDSSASELTEEPMKSRKPVELGERINKRWLGYAAAAGAAGAGMLAATAPAQADIIYKYASTTIPVNGTFTLNLDGAPAFTLANFATVHTRTTGTGFGGRIHYHSGGAGMNVRSRTGLLVGSGSSARRLPHGAFIGSYQKGGFTAGGTRMGSVKGFFGVTGSSRRYYPGQGWRTYKIDQLHPFATSQLEGSWAKTGSGYLGFLFSAAEGVHYGWASFDITKHSSDTSVYYQEVLTGYAYNSDPKAPITAGEGFRAPEPGTLGLLALGSLGLGLWRRRRSIQER
jgi:hypothetical protein